MVTFIKRDKNDIYKIPILKVIFKNRYFIKTIQVLVAILFFYAVYYGFENPTKENIFTKNIFWGLFWSFFMVITLSTFGRIFCGICPHGFLGKYITKLGLKLEVPKILKNRYIGITILVIGWWGIYYTFPGFLKNPFATACMFTVLTVVAFLFYFFYKDMSYCKYICPIGNLTKAFQKVSFTKLTTYKETCKSCRTFDCAKACSYNLKPFTFDKKNSMDDCTLCMDCSSACESINFKLIPPSSTLYKKSKIEKSDVWVYLLIFASITITMNLHHALGRTSLAENLPWVVFGKYIQNLLEINYISFVGLFAFLFSIFMVLLIAFLSIFLSSRILDEKFSTVFYSLGYAYSPLFIIAGLSHLLHSFFIRTYSNIGNGFIQGFSLNLDKVEPLASREDVWLHIFNFIPYLAIVMAIVILYKRIQLFNTSKIRKLLAFIFASFLIMSYLFLIVTKPYIMKEYKSTKHSVHTHQKNKM